MGHKVRSPSWQVQSRSPDVLFDSCCQLENPECPFAIWCAPSDKMLFTFWRERVQAMQIGQARLHVEGRSPEMPQGEPTPFLPFPSGVYFCLGNLVLREVILLRIGPPPTCPISLKILDRAVAHPPSACTSLDDDECPFSPFSKRKYLLAQMKQKDELIDSLLKQDRLSHAQSAKCMRI